MKTIRGMWVREARENPVRCGCAMRKRSHEAGPQSVEGTTRCGRAMRERNPRVRHARRGGHAERGETREMRVRDVREKPMRCGCAMREGIP